MIAIEVSDKSLLSVYEWVWVSTLHLHTHTLSWNQLLSRISIEQRNRRIPDAARIPELASFSGI
jgi:hypothetical protein